MKVKELRSILGNINENLEIVFETTVKDNEYELSGTFSTRSVAVNVSVPDFIGSRINKEGEVVAVLRVNVNT